MSTSNLERQWWLGFQHNRPVKKFLLISLNRKMKFILNHQDTAESVPQEVMNPETIFKHLGSIQDLMI